MAKAKAVWVKCPGYENDPHEHDMRDNCWTCAPWWENIATCPVCRRKLATSGYCAKCKKYYDVEAESAS